LFSVVFYDAEMILDISDNSDKETSEKIPKIKPEKA
jgi:hypothetical protein